MHNNIILPVSLGGFHGARNEDGRVFIGDNSLRKYAPKYIKPTGTRNNITCGCETFTHAMLPQSDFDKWRLKRLAHFDKLYINVKSTRILQRSKKDYDKYKNRISSKSSHINIRACNFVSSYHCTSPMTESNTPKRD